MSLKQTPLRLGLMCTIAPDNLIGFIKAVLERHPGVSLKIADAPARQLEDDLLAGELEVAIYATPGKPRDSRLHYIPLYEEDFVAVAPRGHSICAHNVVPIKSLNGQCYLSRINCEFGDSIDHVFDEQQVEWPTVYESERDDWILAMVAAGLGLAFMPISSVKHEGVEARPLMPPFSRQVCLVTVRGRPHSPAVGALVAEASAWLSKRASAVRDMMQKEAANPEPDAR